MATCLHCPTELSGRQKMCDPCKKRRAPKTTRRRRTPVAKPPVKTTAKTQPKPDPAPDPVDLVPAGLRDRGRALWVSLGLTLDSPAGQVALEACRAADRLDELDSVIAGKGVLNLMAFRLHLSDELENGDHEIHVEVSFQNVLAEARQQQTSFRGLLHEISSQVSPAARPAPKSEPTVAKRNPLDELKERRKAKSR